MRHILVHDYFRVDWAIVYKTAKDDIPAFEAQVQAMLSSLTPGTT